MDLPDEVAEGLPAPRRDEPATLRQDIIDELTDHLRCAVERELAKEVTPTEAAENVRRRFGDPRAIARKLWLDAMREKIMSQRLTIVLMVTLVCLSTAATVFAWVALRESRAVNTALLDKMATLTAARPETPREPAVAEANAKVLDQLAAQWCPVKFHCVLGHKGGPPALGVQIELDAAQRGRPHGEVDVEKTSGANGDADCGFVHTGNYRLYVRSPFGGSCSKQPVFRGPNRDEGFAIRPGGKFEMEIVCPPGPLKNADVRFHADWPADLREKKLWLALGVRAAGRIYEGTNWTYYNNGNDDRLVIVDGDGRVVSLGQFWASPSSPLTYASAQSGWEGPQKVYLPVSAPALAKGTDLSAYGDEIAKWWTPTSPGGAADYRQWPDQRFVLDEIAVISASFDGIEQERRFSQASTSTAKLVEARWETHRVLAYHRLPGAPAHQIARSVISLSSAEGHSIKSELVPIKPQFAQFSRELSPKLEAFQEFEPVVGKDNVWNVPLADSLLARLREALKPTRS